MLCVLMAPMAIAAEFTSATVSYLGIPFHFIFLVILWKRGNSTGHAASTNHYSLESMSKLCVSSSL